MRRGRLAAALGLTLGLLGGAGCRGRAGGGSPAGDSAPLLELLARQQYDEVIARVGERSDPESLYLLGVAWAGKARSAPLPTPIPGAPETAVRWKPEERRAIELLERSLAARPDHAAAHHAIAELIAAHALARFDAAPHPGVGTRDHEAEGPEASADAVLQHLAAAVRADPGSTAAAESLVQFATRAGRLADADVAYQEMLRRRREDPALLVRYGDFLAGTKRDPEAALAQYAQALMWRPDDASTRQKVAEIHLAAAAEHLGLHEYAAAEARVTQARRASPDPGSAQGARLRELEERLRDIRGR